MKNKIEKGQLIIPVYLNEKTVIDMLAIIEDGFSMVSEVSSSFQSSGNTEVKVGGGISTKAILDKLLKIQLEGSIEKGKSNSDTSETKLEKVHTNVSLLSKFRTKLIENELISYCAGADLNIADINAGDFIEIEGELQKNPMIDMMEKIIDVFKMIEIFSEKPELGNKKSAAVQKANENVTVKQIKSFLEELKHSGTIDFILENERGTLVLSVQEQYLSNDNISEIIGGHFKVLGKVIKVCHNSEDSINLLRKTTLNILDETSLNELLSAFKNDDLQQYNLPNIRSEIKGPSAIIIPVAIYA
ncbi:MULTISPECIES: hypothetical protein [unclassified Lacrimispora]|uniref:DUF6414 family protein n=1 Tax=unclassified Lacrimispora TaxID=2719232 RepID=UPI00376FD62D